MSEILVQVGNGIEGTPVVDNLTTSDATTALSANQGKKLKELIDAMSYLPVTVYSSTTDIDFLELRTPGIYGRVKDSTHTLTSGYGVLEVIACSSSYILQRFTTITVTTMSTYIRRLYTSDGTWTEGKWYKITTDPAE